MRPNHPTSFDPTTNSQNSSTKWPRHAFPSARQYALPIPTSSWLPRRSRQPSSKHATLPNPRSKWNAEFSVPASNAQSDEPDECAGLSATSDGTDADSWSSWCKMKQ